MGKKASAKKMQRDARLLATMLAGGTAKGRLRGFASAVGDFTIVVEPGTNLSKPDAKFRIFLSWGASKVETVREARQRHHHDPVVRALVSLGMRPPRRRKYRRVVPHDR